MKVLDTISGKVVSTILLLQGEVLTCNRNCQLLIQRTLETSQFFRPSSYLFGKRKALTGTVMTGVWLSHLWNSSLLLALLATS